MAGFDCSNGCAWGFKTGVGDSRIFVFWVRSVREPAEGSSWILSEIMIREFSTRVGLGNMVGRLSIEEGWEAVGRDVDVERSSGQGMEWESWLGTGSAEGERE